MFQRLLICTDLTDGLQRLVHFVPSLAAAAARHITFLHCVPLSESAAIPRVDQERENQARQQLSVALQTAAMQELPEGVEVVVRVESGRSVDTILRVATEQQAELIMLGLPLRSSVSERLFGSTALGIYERTKIPLLLIRPPLISTYTAEELDLRCRHFFRYLMVPYDGSDASRYLVEQIKEYAAQQESPILQRCYVCWVVDSGERRDIPREPALQVAQDAVAGVKAELEAIGLQVETDVRSGSAVAEILKAALNPDVGAIAVCHNSRSKLLEFSIPSFCMELFRQSWHPILYFPGKK